jgi:pimeloyl-ACP methyl ester carboxylesterase
MPITRSRGVNIYYETVGSGPPVLLISGQGMTLAAWWRTVAELSRSFCVLTFDNRDIGRSSPTPWPYVIAQMAEDAVSVLDAAGAQRAHVYGMSLGGMVAQEVALRHPDRVSALVLGSTTAGGSDAILDPWPMSFFVRAGAMAPEEAEWAAVPYNYSLRTRREHGERIAEDIARRIEHQTDTLAYLHQVAAAATHNAVGRLGSINAPTLVVQGEEDVVMPPLNGRLLAQGIPGAQLKAWPDAAHVYTTDEPEADRHIAQFLLGHPFDGTDGQEPDSR